jgi:CRP-like cAMP-binding protein
VNYTKQINGEALKTGGSNSILESLPDSEYEALRPSLEPIYLNWHEDLHEPGETIEFGYFPGGGVVSLVVATADGRTAEVGVVGREGFVGLPLLGGFSKGPHRALVQAPSNAYRLDAEIFQRMLPDLPHLCTELTRYALLQGMQVAQTAGCNRLHDLEQRLGRWLLMCQDRVGLDLLPLTHELLSTMLGTDRPSVTIAAGSLQRKGVIEYSRGNLRILNRERLQQLACECYAVIRQFNGLAPSTP